MISLDIFFGKLNDLVPVNVSNPPKGGQAVRNTYFETVK